MLQVVYLVFNEGYSASAGPSVLLEQQDRTLWDRTLIDEGLALVERALRSRRVGLYDVLARVEPSPVVALNRAVAVAMRDGPAAGLAEVDRVLADDALDEYHLAHSARADLCRRLGRLDEARDAYARALHLAKQEPERRFLQARLRALEDVTSVEG